MAGEEIEEPDAGAAEATVVSSVDRSGAYEQFVIEDVSGDDQWVSVRHSEALSLHVWR
ncbi:MAG: hypothetical protein ABEH78_01260 [Haloferacaceae archaeon]